MENLDMNALSYDKRFNTDFRRTSSIPMLIKSTTANHYPKPTHSYSDSSSPYCSNNQPPLNYGLDNSRPNSGGKDLLTNYLLQNINKFLKIKINLM